MAAATAASGLRLLPLAALVVALVHVNLAPGCAAETRSEDAEAELSRLEALVHTGEYDTVREIVKSSHQASEEHAQKVAGKVRQAVQLEKNRLDDLIRALDRNYGKAAEVSPASQWAQNSTHLFLSVKFAQRWNAPGALEVENETITFTDCCFNFTAFGEHSMIRRRYHLSWELYQPVLSRSCTWSWAAAGRMTVIMPKLKEAKWPRMLKSASASPKNLGVWHDMQERWANDLERLRKEGAGAAKKKDKEKAAEKSAKKTDSKEKKPKKKRKEVEEDDDDALDREVELLQDCGKSSYVGTSVTELCSKVWRKVVKEPLIKNRRWLVEMYSSQGDGNSDSMKRLMPVWRRLADTFPSMFPGGKVGALDCALEKEFCRNIGVPLEDLPQVWRFSAGDAEIWDGDFSASIEDYADFGGKVRTEL